jgi:hypothetical protein
VLGLRWFGPKDFGGIGPRTWQAWIVIAIYIAVVLGVVPNLHISGALKHQIWGLATGALIAIMLLTYKSD